MARDIQTRSGSAAPSTLAFAAILLLAFVGSGRSQIRINSNRVVVPVSV